MKRRRSGKPRWWAAAPFVVAAAALALGTFAGSTRADPAPFAVADLGTLGGSDTTANGVNSDGRVIGYSTTPTGVSLRAFTWTQTGGMVDLGTLGGTRASPASLNDAGQVVGWTTDGYGASRAFSWTEAAGMTNIGTGGSQALNESGQVVGQNAGRDDPACVAAPGTCSAFLWTQAHGPTSLGTLGGVNSIAYDVNEGGQVVGESFTVSNSTGSLHGFSWTSTGGMVDIGTLAGDYTIAQAVNDAGQIVGYSMVVGGKFHAFVRTSGGTMIDLGPGYARAVSNTGQVVGNTGGSAAHAFSWTQSGGLVDLGPGYATDVSDSGQVVGGISTTSGTHAFSWTQAGGLVDLGTLGGSTSTASAVNERGWIVGQSSDATGLKHAVLWMPNGPVPPDAPTAVSAVAGNGQAIVSFTAPDSNGGAAITSYMVIASPGGSSASGAASPITVTGLSNGTSYTFTVAATNAAGTGLPSAASGPITPAAPPSGGGGGGGDTTSTTTTPTPPTVPLTPPAPGTTVPTATKSVVRPVIAKPTTVPRTLVAGSGVAVSFKVTRSDTGLKLTSGRMICDPSVNGKVLKHQEQFAKGIATLRFTIPKAATGKLLKVHLTIKLGGQSATRSSSFRIS